MTSTFLISRGVLALGLLLALPTAVAFAETVESAVRRGDAAAARAALETLVAGRADAGLHRAQLEGMLALRRGDFREAEKIFRAILSVAPTFEPAQMQLVVALEQQGRTRAAAVSAERLAATTEDARLRDALLRSVATDKSARKSGVALNFALLPSSNLTGGTKATTVMIGGLPFTVSEASREAAGLGLNFGLTGWHSWDLSQQWRATASASANARLFETPLKADEIELGVRLDLAKRGERGNFTFGPRVGLLLQDKTLSRRQFGFGLAGELNATPRLWFGYSAELLRQDFPGATFRNGSLGNLWLGAKWAATPQTTLSVELPIVRETAEAAHLSHRDIGLGLGVHHRFEGGLAVGVGVLSSANRYDGDYPVFGIPRRDSVTSLRLSVQDPRLNWKGLSPEFSVTRKRQSSNIPLHDTWTTDFGLNFSRRF